MFSGMTPLTADTIILSFNGIWSFANSFIIKADGMATIMISACSTTALISILILRRFVLSLVEVK